MRGDITIKILEAVADTAEGIGDFIDVFLSAGYGASMGKFNYELSKRERNKENAALRRRMLQRYYSLLRHLEEQGLIERKKKSDNILIRITREGRKKLFALKKSKKENIPVREYDVAGNALKKLIIIAFDIPEHSKRKREWLRRTLRGLHMRMIQKSVWAGKITLPKEFLSDLKDHNLLDYIEIFEISKTGSLPAVD